MEGKFQYQNITVHYILPQAGQINTMYYLHGTKPLAERLAKLLQGKEAGIFAIEGEDWNGDLSPWQAPAVFRRGEAFAGRGADYLSFLCKKVIPQTEERLGLDVKERGLLGYSLAGLFAVYAMYETTLFQSIASVSGSLWYDGFLDYIKEKEPAGKVQKVYLSLGSRERYVKNERMARVEECTALAKERFLELGISCVFEKNAGNHFYQMEERMEKALRFLLTEYGFF